MRSSPNLLFLGLYFLIDNCQGCFQLKEISESTGRQLLASCIHPVNKCRIYHLQSGVISGPPPCFFVFPLTGFMVGFGHCQVSRRWDLHRLLGHSIIFCFLSQIKSLNSAREKSDFLENKLQQKKKSLAHQGCV